MSGLSTILMIPGIGGGGAAPPATIASVFEGILALHLDAAIGTYQTSGGSVAASGDPVGEWQDQSGNSRHITSSSTSRPTVAASTQNGLPGLLFDKSDDYMERAAFQTGSAGALLFVIKTSASPSSAMTIASTADTSVTSRFLRAYYFSTGWAFAQRGTSASKVVEGDTDIGSSSTYIIAVWTEGGAYKMTVNGVAQTVAATTGSNTGEWAADITGLNVFSLGVYHRTTFINYWGGCLLEMVVTDGATTSQQISDGLAVLNSKYAVY